MKQAILRWVMYFVAMLVAGPLAAALVAPLQTADGGTSASPMVSSTPIAGIGALLGASAIALLTGIITARLVGSMRAGMIAAGLVLAWVAFQSAQLEDLVRARQSSSVLWTIAFEGALAGTLVVIIASGIVLLSGQTGGDDDPAHAPHLVASPRTSGAAHPMPAMQRIFGESMIESLMGVGAGVVAGGLAAFLVAVTPLKGQTIAAGIVGGLAAAAAGRLVNQRSTLPLLVIACALLAVISPLSGAILGGGGASAVQSIYRGGFLPLAHVMPLDWMAGALLGVPLGVGWAASMVEKRTAPQTAS